MRSGQYFSESRQYIEGELDNILIKVDSKWIIQSLNPMGKRRDVPTPRFPDRLTFLDKRTKDFILKNRL